MAYIQWAWVTFGILCCMLGIFGTLLFLGELQGSNPLSKSSNSTSCGDLKLPQAMTCVRNEVREFYYYNSSNQNDFTFTEEKLKEQGGVCWQYSNYYIRRAKELGFFAETFSFWSNGKTTTRGPLGEVGHVFAVIWDSNLESYCIADQKEIYCQQLISQISQVI